MALVMALVLIVGTAICASAKTEAGIRVLLFPFTTWSASEKGNQLGNEIAGILSGRLEAQGINVLKPPSAKEPPGTPAAKRRVAVAENADYAVWGSLTVLGDGFSLDVSLARVGSDAPARVFFVDGESSEKLAPAVNSVSTDIAAALLGREKIVDIRIKGNDRIEADAVKRVLDIGVGDVYAPRQLSGNIKNIYDMGYFEDIRVSASDTPEGKAVTFHVTERPTVRNVRIKKNTMTLSEEKIKDALSIERGAIVNSVTIRENIKAIEEMYKKKNYQNVVVAYDILERENNQADIEFTIQRGEKFMIREIVFEGNEAYPDKELMKIIETSEKGFFSWLTSSGDLQTDVLQQDVGRLAAHYHNNGYIDARIADPVTEYKDEWIYITFKIEEGNRFKVGTVDIQGDILASEEALKQQLKIPGEDYFNRSLVRRDMMTLNDYYSDRGYFYADIIPQIDRNTDNHTVDITYQIKKGNLVYFDRIIIAGNTKTRDKVIRRQLDVYEQELYSGKRLKKGISRLYRLNYFETVKVDTIEGASRENVDLKIEVEEKATGMFSFGGGYSSVQDFFFTTSVSQQNLFGRGQTLKLKAEIGGSSTQYQLSFTEPWLFDIPLSAGFDLYDWESDYDTYDRHTRGGGLRFGYPVFENTRLYLSNTYETNELKNVSIFAPWSIQTAEDENVTSSVSTSLVYDSRNQTINPTEGARHSVTIENAGGIFGGDVAFTKYTAETGWYIPLIWDFVGFLHSRGGYVHENSDGFLPDYERFYLGGMNSLRGFDWRDIAIQEEDEDGMLIDKGGDKFVQFNAELHFPLFGEKSGLVGLLFYDTGNVYDDDEEIRFSRLRESAGFGVRWYSPMGPIRLERGYILDPREEEDSGGQWEFTMGTAF
ncbi:MAG: outer membrane protein assembly factor BamA [Thermodesulfobacteriota bacterium]|nr:outer membrane protein assembly factor BamA [Thermodesulfobacteriota bacterium]